MMKLVCLEVLIVTIATRAMLGLIGKPPPLPDAIWACVGLVAALTTLVIALHDVRTRPKGEASGDELRPPRIPLARIGPYRRDRVRTRLGRYERTVSLN
jgi:hypothetical protein